MKRRTAQTGLENQYAQVFLGIGPGLAPTQPPAAAVFRGSIASGWPPLEPDPGYRALVDQWLEQHLSEATALGTA